MTLYCIEIFERMVPSKDIMEFYNCHQLRWYTQIQFMAI